jgi:hypothetical protein
MISIMKRVKAFPFIGDFPFVGGQALQTSIFPRETHTKYGTFWPRRLKFEVPDAGFLDGG